MTEASTLRDGEYVENPALAALVRKTRSEPYPRGVFADHDPQELISYIDAFGAEASSLMCQCRDVLVKLTGERKILARAMKLLDEASGEIPAGTPLDDAISDFLTANPQD